MAPLGVRTKLARVHVLDHALAQRGDSLGCHRQLLSGMRLLAPPSSRQGASHATYDLAPGDNACRCARGRSLSRKRFSALARSRGVLRCSKSSVIENAADKICSHQVRLSLTPTGLYRIAATGCPAPSPTTTNGAQSAG